jgi:hypothetical protein
MKASRLSLRIGSMALAALSLAGCDNHGQAASGYVYEVVNFDEQPPYWKFEPLEGAEVVIVWNGLTSALAAQASSCLRAVTTKTDSEGHFFGAAWSAKREGSSVSRIDSWSAVFKPGFIEVSRQDQPTYAAWPAGRDVHVLVKSNDPPPGYDREHALSALQSCPPAPAVTSTQ